MIARQGDVLIISCAEPKELGDEVVEADDHTTLAAGEATGHHHRIYGGGAKLFNFRDSSDRFLRVTASGGVALKHEEHAAIELPPGGYRVRIQCEWSDEEARRVAD